MLLLCLLLCGCVCMCVACALLWCAVLGVSLVVAVSELCCVSSAALSLCCVLLLLLNGIVGFGCVMLVCAL